MGKPPTDEEPPPHARAAPRVLEWKLYELLQDCRRAQASGAAQRDTRVKWRKGRFLGILVTDSSARYTPWSFVVQEPRLLTGQKLTLSLRNLQAVHRLESSTVNYTLVTGLQNASLWQFSGTARVISTSSLIRGIFLLAEERDEITGKWHKFYAQMLS
jgi:hypothetical protein